MVVVDTSVWIEFFRGRDTKLCAHFEALLDADRVALAAPVRVEILGGARKAELPKLQSVMAALPLLVPSAAVWSTIESWLSRAVAVGEHFGVGDLLVAGIAAETQAAVWSHDTDFRRMAKLGWIRVHDTGNR